MTHVPCFLQKYGINCNKINSSGEKLLTKAESGEQKANNE